MGSDARIDTVIVYTERIDRLEAFFRDAVGLGEPGVRDARHVGWALGDVYFGLDAREQVEGRPGGTIAWFRVDDLEATFARCRELGARVDFEPRDRPWGDRIACVFDPDGNRVGLSQRR